MKLPKILSELPELWTVLAMILKTACGVLLIPIALNTVSSQEMGYWYILMAMGGISALADFGLTTTVGRFASSFVNGKAGLTPKGIASIEDPQAMQVSVCNFIAATRTLHLYVAGIAFLVMLLCERFLLVGGSDQNIESSAYTLSFLICLLASTYSAYSRWIPDVLSGLGHVTHVAKKSIIGTGICFVITVVGLYLGFGLIALAAGAAAQPLVTNELLKSKLLACQQKTESAPIHHAHEILSVLWPSCWRMGLVLIGSYLINTASTLIVAHKLGLEETAQYGISNQLIQLLVAMAFMIVQSRMPEFVRHRILKSGDSLAQLFGRQLIAALAIMLIGSMVIIVLAPVVLDATGSKTELLPFAALCFMCLYKTLEVHHSIFAMLIVSDNSIPFVTPALVSGVCIIVLGLALTPSTGIWGVLLSTAIVQACYNNWRVVVLALKTIHKSYGDVLYAGWKSLHMTILKK